jgi:hypothetical protein
MYCSCAQGTRRVASLPKSCSIISARGGSRHTVRAVTRKAQCIRSRSNCSHGSVYARRGYVARVGRNSLVPVRRSWISSSQSAMKRLGRSVRSGPVIPITAHWGVPDPAAVEGPEEERKRAFRGAFHQLDARIRLFIALPIDKLDRMVLQRRADEIGRFN